MRLTWWQYQALIVGHQPDDEEEEAEAPDADFVRRSMERLADRGLMRMH